MSDGGLELIGSLTEACERCWKGSGLPAKVVAAELGIDYKHWTRMFNRNDSRHFPPDKIIALMVLCKSVLPLEWQAWKMGYALHDQELTVVLRALHELIAANGTPKFRICDSGRVEKA